MKKRIFLIVLDSFGIGELPDAADFNDQGSNTLKAVCLSKKLNLPTMKKLGLFNIDGVLSDLKNSNLNCSGEAYPLGCYAKTAEKSAGKDTTVGHWEIAGLISKKPMPTYPNGFSDEIISEFESKTGKKVICNKPYSGTEVIKDYGLQHQKTGDLIVYTSADSVFQIAAHEDVVPVNELYEYCKIARKILQGENGVGRVIARPFNGEYPNYKRTSRRHDFSIAPPKKTALNLISESGKDVIGIGKINDIFSGSGVTEFKLTSSNADGMSVTENYLNVDFDGLCFTNLVDFDAVFGHRNDVDGYANALTEFDNWLATFILKLQQNDLLIITADHGCDPSTPSTDHSREYTPTIFYGKNFKNGVNLGVRQSFSDISATVLAYLGVNKQDTDGESFLNQIIK